MKYWSTFRPSRKLAVMGVSMISPDGLAISPAHPGQLTHLLFASPGTGVGHHQDGIELLELALAASHLANIASETRSVASDQMAMTLL